MNIQPERIQVLDGRAPGPGDYVLYWMQAAQRARGNPALERAVELAWELDLPVLVVFGLTSDYPEASARAYRFMLEGLQETSAALARRGIRMVVRRGRPDRVALEASRRAAAVVVDRGYLRIQRTWQAAFVEEAGRRVERVEGEAVVPVEVASGKAEVGARTLRPRIHRQWERFLVPLEERPVRRPSLHLEEAGVDLSCLDRVLQELGAPPHPAPVSSARRGGTGAALEELERFWAARFPRYAAHRSQPQTDDTSGMAAYLHFGQVSPVELALEARARGAGENQDTFLEELIVRRELALNFVHFTPGYDRYEEAAPEWARKTLAAHAGDLRQPCYGLEELEEARTRDPYWNAAMREMVHTGYMHNYMRMYWGKKVLEWSPSPEQAFAWLLELNNRYLLDGRDPNSYAGVAWIFGRHDRPWGERPVYGTVRCMMASGLLRKCDPEAYVRKVEARIAALPPA